MVERLGLAGDWHGNTAWAKSSVRRLARDHGVTTLLHAGDFGIWPGTSGEAYLHKIERVCADVGLRLLVTPGNHENWARINRMPVEARDDLGPVAWFTDHIAVLPRGHRFMLNDRTFVSLGGAPSVDYHHRIPGKSWWKDEAMTESDVQGVASQGHAEVMLTHDSPQGPWWAPKVAEVCGTNRWGWPDKAIAYAAEGRQRLTVAFDGVRPALLVHGHYHVVDEALVEHEGHTCRIVSLHMDGQVGNLALLDTRALTVEWLGVRKDPDVGWARA